MGRSPQVLQAETRQLLHRNRRPSPQGTAGPLTRSRRRSRARAGRRPAAPREAAAAPPLPKARSSPSRPASSPPALLSQNRWFRDADIGGGESTYSDVSLNPGLMPWDQPRGPQGQPAEWNPVPEPGLDARDVDGGEWDPASQLGSRPEGPADLMDVAPQRALPDPRLASRWHPRGPETWNEELKTGKYSPVLKEMKEDLEKAVPGVTGSEGHPASPPSSRTEALSDHTGPERGKGASRGGYYAWWSSRVQRKPVMKIGEAVHGGTKGTDQETVQKKPLQEGSSDTQPVSDRNAQAEQAAALPGVDVGKITKAAVGKELQKRHIPVVAVVSAALLSVLTLACIPMLWMWKKYL
ncbi:uncharacterized protein LOC128079313 [Tympanuchus pallidicinctus]|uniref:uncharacterized protein LOC128079313 n=1 Tax=Tympanuchus pallidicinctus TaxID=109042 RepID=UPI002287633A|nr:uncharacterized protein LOC128079313 [Tympanuchus pallidicinctus]